MPILGAANALSSVITASATATKITDLMDTAGSVTTNGSIASGANYIRIKNEDATNGVRVLVGVDPTATAGYLILKGTTEEFKDVSVEDMRLITVAGTPKCSVILGTNIR